MFSAICMFLVGVFAVWLGAEAVARRELVFRHRRRVTSIYTGLAAQLVGLIFVLFGACLMVTALAGYFARGEFDAFWSSPHGHATGKLLAAGAGALYGGALLAGGAYMSPQSWFKFLRRALRAVGGALLLVVSLCVGFVSAADLLAPGWLIQVNHPLLELYRRWLG